ncbi:MAG: hypothetical protein ABL897_12270 [Hyphomicrobium sp.]
MGADVPIVVELKTPAGWLGVWASDTGPSVWSSTGETLAITWRDYDLFGRLAGVRREGPAPKGWPQDVSSLAAWCAQDNGGDYHSLTWYTLAETLAIYNAADSWAGTKKSRKFEASDFSYSADYGEVRVLFAFDN